MSVSVFAVFAMFFTMEVEGVDYSRKGHGQNDRLYASAQLTRATLRAAAVLLSGQGHPHELVRLGGCTSAANDALRFL